ncbi:diacylglycerol kinase [bacterium (Candidatus Blackallbacteria) CG17_big_fil_post_rev_8_21_14_2_50_48_46]|uniref:Diacylglycerol kinase n=1 Tax=bacterium (Candidatus Blackallbacteria) CG17_big_fil_post_rev_8_21_14_2_50_48_46 TaxID=2014261 RepID=A0A2M7G4V6_9BACT|nr:MAG: diacylglycerol kinase [bacterium (Candidatus Blackallbacteria) CG18_big_fil_WC_8_21_14_2_50_49_26]PIW16951.1 MAG: diacylglycerol kinase [bacterium (Candidatus Blackallbacteria) CG17_big_fil_post_rev_8_21_14_2_50_48_46]PIW50230.1 MAG: diacylglycerol kinase [bacterium (Candidatus Blackallbacteria) CG13_big_fil_rev_8_21_14_2_50_49_14]
MKGFKKFLLGFRWAGEGLVYALKTQRNMQVHAAASLLALSLSLWLNLLPLEWAVLFLTLGLVLSLELLNTALEASLNHLAPEIHPQVKIAKDVAAGAVLAASIAAVAVGLCLWGPKLLNVLRH